MEGGVEVDRGDQGDRRVRLAVAEPVRGLGLRKGQGKRLGGCQLWLLLGLVMRAAQDALRRMKKSEPAECGAQ